MEKMETELPSVRKTEYEKKLCGTLDFPDCV